MDATSPPEPSELDGSRAPFLEHLGELRMRLWRAILGVLLASVICFAFHDAIFKILTRPLFEVLPKYDEDARVVFRTITGAFMFHFKTAILGGVVLGVPIILYQLWMFVAPGLYRKERRFMLPFVVLSTLCFVGGAAFAYFNVLGPAFNFLLGYAFQDGPYKLVPDIAIEDYLSFTTRLLLAFGLVFEMPVAVAFLAGIGLITHRVLIKYWRYAIVGAFIIGALLTPPDWVTQVMLALPLVALYAVSIGVAFFISRRRARAQEAIDEEPSDEEASAEGADADDAGPDGSS